MVSFAAVFDASQIRRVEGVEKALLAEASACAWHDGKLYVASQGKLLQIDLNNTHEIRQLQDPIPVVTALAVVANGTLLVALGSTSQQQPRTTAVLAFWSIDGHETFGNKLKVVPMASEKDAVTSTCWYLHNDSKEVTIAVGCEDLACSVKLYYFALTLKNGANAPGRHVTGTFEAAGNRSGDMKITNVLLRREAGDERRLKLFITVAPRREGDSTTGRLLCKDVDQSKQEAPNSAAVTLDDAAIMPGCLCACRDDQAVLVSEQTSDGSKPGNFSSQLNTYTAESKLTSMPLKYKACSALVHVGSHIVALAACTQLDAREQVIILDLKNRLELGRFQTLASKRDPGAVKFLLPAGTGVCIVQRDGSCSLLQQKAVRARTDAITTKKHYLQAIGVAEDALSALPEGRDEHAAARSDVLDLIKELTGKYASWLLERANEPEAAMAQYIKTIGHLSVSTVIQQFLDTKHAHLLRRYLEAVNEHKDVMCSSFAAVLLSLYVQQRDRDSLRAFIHGSMVPGHGYKWNVEDAITTCLNGGYFEEARMVAEATAQHSKMLEICLDHLAGEEGGLRALQYIQKLARPDQELLLQQHGRTLISTFNLEMKVTPFVSELCAPPASEDGARPVSQISKFVKIYEDAPGALRVLCHTLLNEWLSAERQHGLITRMAAQGEVRLLFHQLFQLLLDPQMNMGVDGLQEAQRLDEAKRFLQQGWEDPEAEPMYAYEHVQRLCCVHRFKDGLLFLYRQANDLTMQQQVLVEYREWEQLVALGVENPGERGEHLEAVMRCLVAEHDAHPAGGASVWIASILEDMLHNENLKRKVVPLSIINILAASESLTLDIVKPFIFGHVQRLEASSLENKRKIDKLAKQTAAAERDIHRIKNEPMWIERERTDDMHDRSMNSSAVYFFCGHAHNEEDCEKDGDRFICPSCEKDPQRRLMLSIADPGGESRTSINENFFNQFRQSTTDADTFRIIGEHLGNTSTAL